MSVRIASCWISLNVLLGFVVLVRSEHFYLPKENNNVFSNDLQDDWVPISGIDKRSTRLNQGITKVVHITPPVRYPIRPSNQQAIAAAASNKVEVFAQPPPTILGSFSEFGHATIEAREPAHTLNFRPSYHFERHYDEINDRRYQQNDYPEPEDQTPPAIVVFNAQQRHPQNYLKSAPPPPPQFYQNFPYSPNKNFGFKEPPAVQEAAPLPKRLTPYFVPNDHVFPRPLQPQQGNGKQAYAEQRPKPYLVTSSESIQQQQQQQQQQQYYQQPQQQQQQQHYRQPQPQQQQPQKQQYKTSTTDGLQSSSFFHKYPGKVIDGPSLFPQVSNFARPFEQTANDHSVFIKPNQHVHNLNVGTEMRFGPEQPTRAAAALPPQELTTASVTHPATRPFSKYQTPTPKNEELYRIFPVKEVNALPAFLPTPITLHTLRTSVNGRPDVPYRKETAGGSSEYDEARDGPVQPNENDSAEQYDIMRSPTRPMATTTTTMAPPRLTARKRKPTTTTSTTAAPPPDEYDEYAVPNRQQLQLQEEHLHRPQQEYEPQQQQHLHQQQQYDQHRYEPTTTTEAANEKENVPVPVSVNKYKKKKPLPAARPKEPRPEVESDGTPERAGSSDQASSTAATTTTTTTATATTAAATPSPQQSSAEAASTTDVMRTKTKLKYGNGTRPRFSIKDYKTTTSTTTTTTEKSPSSRRVTTTTTAATPETGRKPYKPRLRPNRYRQSTTTSVPEEQAAETTTTPTPTTTDRTAYRNKYKPGKYYNRSRTSTTESAAAAAAASADESGETAVTAAAEPTRPAVFSAKRRTVPTARTTVAAASSAEENNALRRSSSAAPLIGAVGAAGDGEDVLDVASSEDVDYVTTTTAVTPSPYRHKFHTSYAADRPLLPIESFFQSSMTGKRHRHAERR